MKKKLYREIEIPEGVEVSVDGGLFSAKGKEGENKREFDIYKLVFEKKGNKIIIGCDKATKREKKKMNTFASRVKNMIKGVQEKYEYQVKVCSSHFPMSVSNQGREFIVKNFLGEKIPRKAILPEGVDIEIKKDIITIKSIDKEKAGLAAAALERTTRITNKDRRVFQDGLYIINKAGREI
jgi:large subunit ribosomal protein L6